MYISFFRFIFQFLNQLFFILFSIYFLIYYLLIFHYVYYVKCNEFEWGEPVGACWRTVSCELHESTDVLGMPPSQFMSYVNSSWFAMKYLFHRKSEKEAVKTRKKRGHVEQHKCFDSMYVLILRIFFILRK